jgi:uncharacterized protein involved in copper resistance
VSDSGHLAAHFEGSYDLLLTNRLILQPEVEIDLYSKSDPARLVGAGISDIDTGLRLRYEFDRNSPPISVSLTKGNSARPPPLPGVPARAPAACASPSA